MNQLRTPKIASISLIILVVLLILAQFGYRKIETVGAMCTFPPLGAPPEFGHPAYQFVSYGFPVRFVTIGRANCFSEQSATYYEWFFPGIAIDGLLLGLILLLWSQRVRKKVQN